jgi:hypothetical protein
MCAQCICLIRSQHARRLVFTEYLQEVAFPTPIAEELASPEAALAKHRARNALMTNLARIYKLAPACASNTNFWAQGQEHRGAACEVSALLCVSSCAHVHASGCPLLAQLQLSLPARSGLA